MDSARKAAYLALRDVEENKAYSGFAVRNAIGKVSPDRPAFVRELVYGTIQDQLYLDNIIGAFINTPVGKLPVSDRVLLRMGVYQHRSLDSVPDYAAVSETVELAKRYSRGREKFINGVLRQYIRTGDAGSLPGRDEDEAKYLSLKYSFAPWIVDMWLSEYGNPAEVETLLDSLNQKPQLCIRTNSLRIDSVSLKEKLSALGFDARADKDQSDIFFVSRSRESGRSDTCSAGGSVAQNNGESETLLDTDLYKEGLFSVQDKGSWIAAAMLGAKPGDTVIDVCAAPGGKTMAIAEEMNDTGRIIALDKYEHKIKLIEDEANRLGVSIVEASVHDSTKTIEELEGKADRVLVDVPCSGLGTARRKPEVKYKEFDEAMKYLPKTQLDILEASAKYVKPGGTMVYATCTIARRENQNVIDAFLKNNKDWIASPGVQLTPTDDETDGFFIAKMMRSETARDETTYTGG